MKLTARIPNSQTKEETDAALAELKQMLRMPPVPVPDDALRLLYEAACLDTGGSQAARYFLFWLVGKDDPTGFQGDGGLELRRLDGELKNAALQVMEWWDGPTKNDAPLHQVLEKLKQRS